MIRKRSSLNFAALHPGYDTDVEHASIGQGKSKRLERNGLARKCVKLDPAFEKALAEEGLSEELDEFGYAR